MLEGLEERLVLSLVAASAQDTRLNPEPTSGHTEPSVAMDANGDYVVAWNNGQDVDAQVYNAAGQPLTGLLDIANTTGQTRCSVAMDAAGDFVVAWQAYAGYSDDNGNPYYSIKAQRYNLAGVAQGKALTITPGNPVTLSPQVAMDAGGDFVIAYQGHDNNGLGVFAKLFNASGGVVKSTFGVNSFRMGDQGDPSVAMDAAGNFVIAWDGAGPAQTGGVFAQRYNAAGVAQGVNTAISTIVEANSPSVAMESTGQYAIAWQFQPKNQNKGIEAQGFAADGTALTSVIPVSTAESNDQISPSVAIDGQGDFVVAWESYGVVSTTENTALSITLRVIAPIVAC
jgi:hypothetical protein